MHSRLMGNAYLASYDFWEVSRPNFRHFSWKWSHYLDNSNVDDAGAPASIPLIGSNNASGNFGETRFTFVAPSKGKVTLDWSYTTIDGPDFDPFGFLDGDFLELTNPFGGLSQQQVFRFA